LAEGCNSSADDTTGFRVTDSLLDLEKAGKELREERSHYDWRVDKLRHVVDDATAYY
jgi:hypothetical protein